MWRLESEVVVSFQCQVVIRTEWSWRPHTAIVYSPTHSPDYQVLTSQTHHSTESRHSLIIVSFSPTIFIYFCFLCRKVILSNLTLNESIFHPGETTIIYVKILLTTYTYSGSIFWKTTNFSFLHRMNMNVNKKELEQGVSPAMISSFNLMQGKRKIQYRKKENTIH